MANDTRFGLAAAIFTQNVDTAMRFALEVDSGNININWKTTFRADMMPYGGLKDSGLGKEGPPYAIEEMTEPRLLLCDEPTRGVDVGAKAEIYELMNELVEAGLGIVLISSELPELLAMSDRIYVMHRGRTVAEFDRAEATQEAVMRAAMGEK